MTFSELLPYIVTAFSLVTASTLYLQARLIHRSGSDQNISHLGYITVILANVFWLLYGREIHSMALMVTSVISGGGAVAIMIADLAAHRSRAKR